MKAQNNYCSENLIDEEQTPEMNKWEINSNEKVKSKWDKL